jgi:hypothetical protein
MNEGAGGGGVEVNVTCVEVCDLRTLFSGGTGAAVGYLPCVGGERGGRCPF